MAVSAGMSMPVVSKGMLEDGPALESRVDTINQGEGRYRLTFYLHDPVTGYALDVYSSEVLWTYRAVPLRDRSVIRC